MKVQLASRLLICTSTIALSAFSLAGAVATPALADCSLARGGPGPDLIICDESNPPPPEVQGRVEGGPGDDTIKIGDGFDGASIYGDGTEISEHDDTIIITGGTMTRVVGDSERPAAIDSVSGQQEPVTIYDDTVGDDVITLTGGEIREDVRGQSGSDTILIDGADIGGRVQGDRGRFLDAGARGLVDLYAQGNDTITVLSGTVGGDVEGQALNDVITIGGGTIGGSVRGDYVPGDEATPINDFLLDIVGSGRLPELQGDDTIAVNGGDIGGDVLGDGRDDSITIRGGTVGGSVYGDSNSDDDALLPGDDLIELSGGSIGGDVLGGGGDDTGIVSGDFDFDDLGDGDGSLAGDGNTETDGGFDTLIFTDWTGDVNADRLPEWNEGNIVDGSAVTFTGGTWETDGDSAIEVRIDRSSALLANNDLPGGGNLTIEGNLRNLGLVDLSSRDGETGNRLIVTGAYIGGDIEAPAGLTLNTFLDDGKSLTPDENSDILDVDTASGVTAVTINAIAGSPGGLTGDGATDGILVVEARESEDEAFFLVNEVTVGAFEYGLVNPDGQPEGQDNWYLQSMGILPQTYPYEALPGALQRIALVSIGQLVERVGVRSAVPSPLTDADGQPLLGSRPVDSALWARVVGVTQESEGDIESTTGGQFDQDIGFVQAGGEVRVAENEDGRLLFGVMGHIGNSSLDVTSPDGLADGSADIDFYGAGLTATWYATNGFYLDAVAQYTVFDIDLSARNRWSSQSVDGYGLSFSGEVGYRIALDERSSLVPQAQLVWTTVDFDDFTDPDDVYVSLQDGDSLVGRIGVAYERSGAIGRSLATGYLEANILHEFLGDNAVSASGTTLRQNLGGTSFEVGGGMTVALSDRFSLYAEVDYTIPFDAGAESLQGLVGVRYDLSDIPDPIVETTLPVVPVAQSAFIVFFDWDRANLTAEANSVLDDVVVAANQNGYASVRLDGYTDLSGPDQYNLGLSNRRANAVANGLIARGIAPDEIVVRGYGETNPLVPTPNGVREAQNRRVEIFLL